MKPYNGVRRRTVAASLLGLPLVSAWGQPAPLRIGVLPNISARAIAANYQPLREFLQAQLGREVQIQTAPDFAAFHERAVSGAFDLFVTAPNLAALALADGRARTLGVCEPGIPALAVALRDNAAGAVAALRGRALALANPTSLVALRGIVWLREQGLEEGRDFRIVRVANEDSLGQSLTSGDAPLAIMSRGEFNQISESRRASLAVVQQFALLPGFFVMAPTRVAAADGAAWVAAWRAAFAAPEGAAFTQASGVRALREVTAADLAAVDPFVEATRKSMTAGR